MLNREDFEELFNDESIETERSSTDDLDGLNLMAKYFPGKGIIGGADHDMIYGPTVNDLIEADITKDDVIQLVKWNWLLSEDSDYLYHYV